MKINFKIKFLTILLAVLGGSAIASGGVFTLPIHNLDLDAGVDACNIYLSQAAEKFGRDAGVTVISQGCEMDSILRRVSGSIAYSADEPAAVWSTTSTTYGEEHPFYSSRSECEEALEREVLLVRDLTGLDPFLAFCHKVSTIGPPVYRTRIDAVGTAGAWRYEDVAGLRHRLVDVNTVVDVLHSQARDYGIGPVAWYEGTVRSTRGLAVAFYDTADRFNRWYLQSQPLRYVSTLQECERAKAIFESTRTTEWTGVTACSAAHPTVGFQLNLLWWGRSISSSHGTKSTLLPASFSDMEQCWSQAATISQQLTQTGEQIVGISCGRDHSIRSTIKMLILSKINRG